VDDDTLAKELMDARETVVKADAFAARRVMAAIVTAGTFMEYFRKRIQ